MPPRHIAEQDRGMTNDSPDRGPGPWPAPGGPTTPPGHGTSGFFQAIRRAGVYRSQERWVGGVAGGVAARFGIDPLLARGIIGVSMLLGVGFVLYGLAWALLPEQADGRIHAEEMVRGNFDVALLGAAAMLLVGFSGGDWWFSWGPFSSGWLSGLAWAAAVTVVIVILVNALRQRKDGNPHGSAPFAWQPPNQEGPVPMSSTSPAGPSSPARPAGPPSASAPVPPFGASPAAAPPRPSAGYAPAPAWAGNPTPPPGRGWTPPPPVPPVPPVPPKAPKPSPRGPGAAITGVVVAVILLGLAGLLAAERAGVYDGPIASVLVGGGVVLVGLAIIVSGLRGRRAGGLTALAIIGMVVAGPTFVSDRDGYWHGETGPFRSVDVEPRSRSAAAAGFSFGIGDAEVDQTHVPLTDDTLVVPVSGGIGDVTVVVPRDIPVSASVSGGIGSVEWRVDGSRERSDGVGHDRTFTSDAMDDGSPAQIALELEVGIGSITIEED
jgi:phage shock protein PspC (stress-responsive transcriptional regulator)